MAHREAKENGPQETLRPVSVLKRSLVIRERISSGAALRRHARGGGVLR